MTPKAVSGLLKATMLIMIALGFPVKTLMVFLRNALKKQPSTFRSQDFIDLGMGVMVCMNIYGTFTLSKSTKYLGDSLTDTFPNRLFTNVVGRQSEGVPIA